MKTIINENPGQEASSTQNLLHKRPQSAMSECSRQEFESNEATCENNLYNGETRHIERPPLPHPPHIEKQNTCQPFCCAIEERKQRLICVASCAGLLALLVVLLIILIKGLTVEEPDIFGKFPLTGVHVVPNEGSRGRAGRLAGAIAIPTISYAKGNISKNALEKLHKYIKKSKFL